MLEQGKSDLTARDCSGRMTLKHMREYVNWIKLAQDKVQERTVLTIVSLHLFQESRGKVLTRKAACGFLKTTTPWSLLVRESIDKIATGIKLSVETLGIF
jgi:hypothetical protein